LVSDSADDHESLHAYALPGIVMYAHNALLSAEPVDAERAERPDPLGWRSMGALTAPNG
jgi:hypothetical protein